MNSKTRRWILLLIPGIILVGGFIGYYSGVYQSLSITSGPITGIALLTMAAVIIYQQIVIQNLQNRD